MAVKPLKDPRFRPIRVPGSTARRYVVVATGETITRAEFERRTAQKPATGNPTGPTTQPTQTQAARRKTQVEPGHGSSGRTGPDPMVVAEAPAPPPVLDTATKVGQEAAAVAEAAKKSQEALADKVGEGIALCMSYMSSALLPDHLQYLVLPDAALAKVIKPVSRITARHMPIALNGGLGDDGNDLVELFNGLMLCATAISTNKLLAKQQQKEQEDRYEQLDTTGRPGDAAPAAAVPAGPLSGARGKARHQGPAAAAANGAGNSAAHNGHGGEDTPADAARKVALIRDLYQRDADKRRQRRGL